ncbi:hypothetical protein ACC734_39735, partial [Rhizobium ruizarguesonis]
KSRAKAHALLDALRIFGLGYSWGGYESLSLHAYLNDRTVAKAPTDGPVIRLQICREQLPGTTKRVRSDGACGGKSPLD